MINMVQNNVKIIIPVVWYILLVIFIILRFSYIIHSYIIDRVLLMV